MEMEYLTVEYDNRIKKELNQNEWLPSAFLQLMYWILVIIYWEIGRTKQLETELSIEDLCL